MQKAEAGTDERFTHQDKGAIVLKTKTGQKITVPPGTFLHEMAKRHFKLQQRR